MITILFCAFFHQFLILPSGCFKNWTSNLSFIALSFFLVYYCTKLVGNLDPRVTEQVLHQIFSTNGEVLNVKIIYPELKNSVSAF